MKQQGLSDCTGSALVFFVPLVVSIFLTTKTTKFTKAPVDRERLAVSEIEIGEFDTAELSVPARFDENKWNVMPDFRCGAWQRTAASLQCRHSSELRVIDGAAPAARVCA